MSGYWSHTTVTGTPTLPSGVMPPGVPHLDLPEVSRVKRRARLSGCSSCDLLRVIEQGRM